VFWTGNDMESGLIDGPFETEDKPNNATNGFVGTLRKLAMIVVLARMLEEI
jgi:hypothetical protein